MSTVEEITRAIERLPAEQFAQVRDWVVERAEREWDEQIEADEKVGRLDGLIDRAQADYMESGRRGADGKRTSGC